jgi:hypothetical protein
MTRKPSQKRRFEERHFLSPDTSCYLPERDGALEQYLAAQFRGDVFRLFKGFEHFELLRAQGWFVPGMSAIRVMYNVGRGDEIYSVTESFQLKGIEHSEHGAPPGIVDPAVLLAKAPPFEAHSLHGPAYTAMMDRQIEEERKHFETLDLL